MSPADHEVEYGHLPLSTDRFYILSLKHSQGPMLTWWRPNEAGYCWSLDHAGLYDEERAKKIEAQSLHNGIRSCVAVPEAQARALAYPIVENDSQNYARLGTSASEMAQARRNG